MGAEYCREINKEKIAILIRETNPKEVRKQSLQKRQIKNKIKFFERQKNLRKKMKRGGAYLQNWQN